MDFVAFEYLRFLFPISSDGGRVRERTIGRITERIVSVKQVFIVRRMGGWCYRWKKNEVDGPFVNSYLLNTYNRPGGI